jgi:hypothetical protein
MRAAVLSLRGVLHWWGGPLECLGVCGCVRGLDGDLV